MPLRAGATNEILPFATDVAAPNVIDQEEYARLPARREGFTKGLARSANMNKVWRQSAHMAAALAQFVANHYPPGVRDDGNLDVVELGLMAALAAGLVWSEDVDYTVPCVVIGHNNKLYVALAPSGPNTVNGGQTVGAKTPADPANAAYWKTVMPDTDGTTIEERDDVLTVLAAPKLSTPRNITLSGGATGSASFDGSADAAVNVTGLDMGKANAGTLPVGRGGTGAATAAQALTSLGAASSAVTITAGAGLSGGGNLTANRTLAVKYGTTAGTACQGNDARLTNARTPAAHKATHKTGGTDALTPADIGAAPQAAGPYLCEFYFFRHLTLRPGFQPAQGGLLTNAATLYPEAWAYLQTVEGRKLCKTEAEWQAMTKATWHTNADGTKVGWNGIGGAPWYVQDVNAGTLRLPDLRGMYAEAAGFDSLGVGGAHGDGIREIAGAIVATYRGANSSANGAFTMSASSRTLTEATGINGFCNLSFQTSRVVPTAPVNQPKAWGALACCYLGAPR